jgi:flagellar basal body-associated protein FliL
LESKGTFFILIIIVAVLTLTLAALAGYIFLVQGPSNSNEETSSQVNAVTEVPKETDLATLELYESKKYFNLKNDDPNKIAVIQVGVSLQYFIAIKENKKLVVSEKIDAYLPEIKEIIGTYFLNVTLDQVKDPAQIQKIKDDLKTQINELLNSGEKDKYEYVYKVIFDDWLFQ